jgi:hypothetical protein
LSEAGVAASGVVAVRPAEQVEAGFALVGPGTAALECLSLAGRVEGLGERVVRRAADGAHALDHARLAAGVGERPVRVLRAVVGVQDGSGEAAAAPLGGGQGVGDQFSAHMVGDRPAGQPARRREARSMTVARYRNFPPVSGR